jgi:K+-sensing histidine kinase KdpD
MWWWACETHGRKETMALLEGLEVVPRRDHEHRGRPVTEFDLDGALERRPQLILIDELAHSNVHLVMLAGRSGMNAMAFICSLH